MTNRCIRWIVSVVILVVLAGLQVHASGVSDCHAIPPSDTLWLEVKVQDGDFTARVMRRYLLNGYPCNLEKFYKLNKIDASTKLKKGKKYYLPIFIVKYNGKSIRSSIKIEDIKQALRIQQFNDEAKVSSLRADDFRTSKSLWVPYHEISCPPEGEAADAELLFQNEATIQGPKPALGNRIFPVFGEKYQKTPLLSAKLKGKIYYIVSGHGGNDTGAIGKREKNQLAEDEYAYDVALRLVRHLVSHGATAYMIVRDPNDGIRDTEYLDIDYDELLWGNAPISTSQKQRLQDRCDIINNIYDDYLSKGIKEQVFIEIHVDSRSRNARTDVFFYHRQGEEVGKKLAEKIQNTFLLKYAQVRAQRRFQGSVSGRDLHMLRETKVPKAVYIELGNIQNTYDQLRLVLPKNRQALANWIFDAISQ